MNHASLGVQLERLKALISSSTNESIKPWFGAIADTMVGHDKRWRLLSKCSFSPLPAYQVSDFMAVQIERFGADEAFQKYGIHLPKLALEGSDKKILKREYVLRNHFWLRLRALFDANWRADIVWQLSLDCEQTVYRIS